MSFAFDGDWLGGAEHVVVEDVLHHELVEPRLEVELEEESLTGSRTCSSERG